MTAVAASMTSSRCAERRPACSGRPCRLLTFAPIVRAPSSRFLAARPAASAGLAEAAGAAAGAGGAAEAAAARRRRPPPAAAAPDVAVAQQQRQGGRRRSRRRRRGDGCGWRRGREPGAGRTARRDGASKRQRLLWRPRRGPRRVCLLPSARQQRGPGRHAWQARQRQACQRLQWQSACGCGGTAAKRLLVRS